MAKVLEDLPDHIYSRSEEFLDVIVGRSKDLNSLPVPQSRIEEYLECLAHNGGGGGRAFNDFEQLVERINFKNGNTVMKEMQIVTSQEITSILTNLT